MIESIVVEQFKSCMVSRKDTDYRHVYSEEEADRTVEIAEEFLREMKKLSKKVKPNEI